MLQCLTQISQSPLFLHIPQEDILRMLPLLSAKVLHLEKDAIVLQQGAPCRTFGIVLEGSVHVINSDAGGNHTLISTLHPGDLFAEAFVFFGLPSLPVSIVAAQNSTVLLLDHSRVSSGGYSPLASHSRLIINLVRIISIRNMHLTQKISILSQRTTRDKLMAYLSVQQQLSGSSRFTIPLNRQELADYLCVERSAMSTELSKMKKAGLIACHKNEFEILSTAEHEPLQRT